MLSLKRGPDAQAGSGPRIPAADVPEREESVSPAFLLPGSTGHGRHGQQYTAEQADESDGGPNQEHESLHAEKFAASIANGHSPIVGERAGHPSSGSDPHPSVEELPPLALDGGQQFLVRSLADDLLLEFGQQIVHPILDALAVRRGRRPGESGVATHDDGSEGRDFAPLVRHG